MLKRATGKIHNKALGIAVLFVVALAVVTIFNIIIAKGAPGDEYKNMYALRVDTALTNANDVGTFIVTYADPSGAVHRSYINPYDGDYSTSLALALNHFDKGKIIDIGKEYTDNFGYEYTWTNGDGILSEAPLQKNSTNTYFFNTYYEASKIISIGVMTGDAKGAKTFSCYGMSLYKVSSIDGFIPCGYASNSYEVAFSGTLLEELEYKKADGSDAPTCEFTYNDKNGVTYIYDSPSLSKINKDYQARLVPHSEPYTNTDVERDEYTIKLDIADVYMAGFESYVAKTWETSGLSRIKPAELLVLNLTYKTNNGSLRVVNIPVITASLSYAMKTAPAFSKVQGLVDILPQGNSIALKAYLPEFKEITDSNLIYVSADSGTSSTSLESLVGLKSISAYKDVHNKYYTAAAANKDRISVTGVQIYEGGSAVSVEYSETASLKFKLNENAKLVCAATSSLREGYSLNVGTSQKIKFEPAGGQATRPVDNRDMYIFQAKTSDLINAGTTSDISAKIQYIDESDVDREIEFSFKEQCKEFYGYWPDEKGAEAAYEKSMANGGNFYTFLELPDAKRILGITLSNTADDDWMASNISIFHIEDNSKIGGVSYKRDNSAGKNEIIHLREINGHPIDFQTDLKGLFLQDSSLGLTMISSIGGDAVADGEDASEQAAGIFISGNKDRVINFSSIDISKQVDNRADFNAYLFDMPYEATKANFGFGSERIQYTITVSVNSNPYGSGDGLHYDDCGSKNYFYFQLVFENGNSAYVQANQQLPSDGFRAGKDEVFYIGVNQDYGALKAINIIPEVDIDLGSPYDKLEINELTVTRTNDNGLDTTYKTGYIGWVGIDYTDNGGEVKYHKTVELAKVYPITSETNNAQLFFSIGYDSIPAGYEQFVGTLTADINYKKTDGTSTSVEVDIVKAMNNFNGTTGVELETDTTQTGKEKLVESNPKLMFRPNHTDRFIWREAADIKYIESIEFHAKNTSGKTAYMKMNNISIRVLSAVDQKGYRSMNSSGEYIIENMNFETNNVIKSVEGNYEFVVDNGVVKSVTVEFDNDPSTCITSFDRTRFPYVVSREPVSVNDTVNIYAYVKDYGYDLSGFTVEGAITFDDRYGVTRTTKEKMTLTTMIDENGVSRQAYCATNLLVRNLGTMKDLSFKATGTGTDINLDYAVVQHVRNNVVLENKKAMFPVSGPSIRRMTATTNSFVDFESTAGYQEITIQFGDRTDTTTLTKERRDVAISLDYTFGTTAQEYHTTNVFITDFKNNKTIKPGDVVKLKLLNANVGKITGISISSTDYLKVDVEAVTVGVYTVSDDSNYECTNWYTFDCNAVVNNETKHFNVTSELVDNEKTWSPVTVKMKTLSSFIAEMASFGASLGLSESDKLAMTVTYDDNGTVKTLTFDNVNDKLMAGSFSTGATAEFTFLAKNLRADNIKKISFRPYDSNNATNVVWGFESFEVSFGDGQTSKSIVSMQPRQIIYEDQGALEFAFAQVLVSTNVQRVEPTFAGDGTGNIVMSTVLEELGSMRQDSVNVVNIVNQSPNKVYKIDVNVQNSSMKYNVTTNSNVRTYPTIEKAIYFSIDGNVSDEGVIKIASEENPDSFIEIRFMIISKESVEVTTTPGTPDESAPADNQETPDNSI